MVQRAGPFRGSMAAAAVAALFAFVAPVSAQRTLEDPSRVFTGVVIDEITREPIAGAVVLIEDHSPGSVTDSLGHFTLTGFPPGPQVLIVRQFGYADITATVDPPRLSDVLVEIPLAPVPFALDGVTAVVDHLESMTRRIESRRRATSLTTQAYDQDRLVRSGAPDVLRFLLQQPSINPTVCSATRAGTFGLCVLRRGRAIRPRVYIDELPALGGLDDLAMYNPQDLYLIEVYSFGTAIRAYTYDFMERTSRRPVALLPVFPG